MFPLLDGDTRRRAQRLFDEVETLVDFEPVLLHADLGPDHLLVRDGRLAGVIDWGDARVGDPALDYAWLLNGRSRTGTSTPTSAGGHGSITASGPGTRRTTDCSRSSRRTSSGAWRGSGRGSERLRSIRAMRTITGRMTLFVLLFALAACVGASSGQASSRIQYGIQDDAWLEYGPGTLDQRLETFKRLGVPLVRFTVRWNRVAPRRPRDATSPRDRAYDWRGPDRVLRGLRRHGLTPVLTLVGTPAWANGGRSPKYAPPRPRDFRRFATAAARRYPWVRNG